MATNIFNSGNMGQGRSRLKNLIDNRDQSGRSSLSRYTGPDARPPNSSTENKNKTQDNTTYQPAAVTSYANTTAANIGGGGGSYGTNTTAAAGGGTGTGNETPNTNVNAQTKRELAPGMGYVTARAMGYISPDMTSDQFTQAYNVDINGNPFDTPSSTRPDDVVNGTWDDPYGATVVDQQVNTPGGYQDSTPPSNVSAMGNNIGYGDTDWAAHQARRDQANGIGSAPAPTPAPPIRDMAAEQARAREYWRSRNANQNQNPNPTPPDSMVMGPSPVPGTTTPIQPPAQTGNVSADTQEQPQKQVGSGPVRWDGREFLRSQIEPYREIGPGRGAPGRGGGKGMYPYPTPVYPHPRFES